jgi:hypothetical protein
VFKISPICTKLFPDYFMGVRNQPLLYFLVDLLYNFILHVQLKNTKRFVPSTIIFTLNFEIKGCNERVVSLVSILNTRI